MVTQALVSKFLYKNTQSPAFFEYQSLPENTKMRPVHF